MLSTFENKADLKNNHTQFALNVIREILALSQIIKWPALMALWKLI